MLRSFSVSRVTTLVTSRVYIDSVILILENRPRAGGRAEVKTMSRHLAAYFAIVGTLAFAGGAADAGQVNIPHINIPRPQISVPTPHQTISPPRISVPTQGLSNLRMISGGKGTAPSTQTLSTARIRSGPAKPKPVGVTAIPDQWGKNPPPGPTNSGNSSADTGTRVNGQYGGDGSYGGGGYSTAGKADTSPSFRCRSKGGKSNCPG